MFLRTFFFTLITLGAFTKPAVTYEFSGGRFGDNLLSYIHARWIAYRFNLPFLYRKFPLSPELIMHEQDTCFSSKYKHNKSQIMLNPFYSFPNSSGQDLLICPYYSECRWEQKTSIDPIYVPDWKNPEFRCLILQKIASRRPLQLLTPPRESINVALHVREGGGFDMGNPHEIQPLKFPPLSFYQACIEQVLQFFPKTNIHFQVFTDSLNPELIADELFIHTLSPFASIGFRRSDNRHDLNVLEDFFSFFQFDILIRPDSNYSIIPSLLYDFALVFSPASFIVENDQVKIDQIKIEKNNTRFIDVCNKHGHLCID